MWGLSDCHAAFPAPSCDGGGYPAGKGRIDHARKSPIRDDYIEKYLAEKELKPDRHTGRSGRLRRADFVVIAAPTNYDSQDPAL